MEKKIEDAISELYEMAIVQKVFTQFIFGTMIGYIASIDKIKSSKIEEIFTTQFPELLKSEILSSQFSQEYLDTITKSFLRGIEGLDI